MTTYRSTDTIRSWGRILRARHDMACPSWRDELPALVSIATRRGSKVLATGLHRSYGISGLNPDGSIIDMVGLDRIISFDPTTRRLEAEAGLSLGNLLNFALPKGLFLPVTPGTRFATIGGAVANDVHGKNHHRNGTIGRWVRKLHLLRTDGTEIELTPDDPSGLFAATIGGLGLTGIVTRVTLELVPITSSQIDAEIVPFANLDEFFSLAAESEFRFEYTVAWIDCLATNRNLGRGIFMRGNHAKTEVDHEQLGQPKLKVPIPAPSFMLNQHTIRAFNALYFRRQSQRCGKISVPLASFFYPLDCIANWNLIYGERGFYQYQSVIPVPAQIEATREMLKTISANGQGSFLAVLKTFGSLTSPGLLSFPREGTTLALDFPNNGDPTLRLFDRLDDIVSAAGGRLYPAKDGRMSPRLFRAGYSQLEVFSRHVDPGMSSAFWDRIKND